MDGFLNLLKPSGITSHDALLEVRHLLGEEKAGHLGTLDPMAIGVLPVALGSYRKLSEYFLGDDKEYLAEFTFGISTDTGDLDGRVVSRRKASMLTPSKVRDSLPAYVGEILQTPPRYSAVKVKGKKLYQLAREGLRVTPLPRRVRIYRFQLVGWNEGEYPRGLFSLWVGSGTYIRSLADSLGKGLGTGATVSFLLRNRAGPFSLKDAITLESISRKTKSVKGTEREDRLEGAKRQERQAVFSSLLVDPLRIFPPDRLFRLRKESIEKVRHGMPLSPEDFAGPHKVLDWLHRGGYRAEDDSKDGSPKTKKPVFFVLGPKRTRYGFPEILAVMTYANKGEEKIMVYEKVLLSDHSHDTH